MNNRTEYIFSYDTKLEALERSFYQCEHCGGYESKKNRFEAHHLVAIFFARETNIPHALIKSLENCTILCKQCHSHVHLQENRQQYAQIAWYIFGIDVHPDYSRDTWRSDPNHPINKKKVV
jgi:5-methylcytosine-specific restriction endonuclease McrA